MQLFSNAIQAQVAPATAPAQKTPKSVSSARRETEKLPARREGCSGQGRQSFSYEEQRYRTINPNFRRAPEFRVRSPRESQKRRMEGWAYCRFVLPRKTLDGLRQLAIILAEDQQHSPWPRERRRYPRTKSQLVGEAIEDYFRKLGHPEFCLHSEDHG